MRRRSLQYYSFVVFAIMWTGVLLLDYLDKNEVYKLSVSNYKYFGLTFFIIVIAACLSGYYTKWKFFAKSRHLPLNGLVILGLFLLFVVSIAVSFDQYWQGPLGVRNYLHLVGKSLYTLSGGYIVVLTAFSYGNYYSERVFRYKKHVYDNYLVETAIGMFFVSLLLLIIAYLGLFNHYSIAATFLVSIAINYRAAWQFVRKTFIQGIIIPSKLNIWGGTLAGLLVAILALNFFYTLAPFPLGFDSRNYYVNISKLIAESEAIVPGYQPYAWGLIQAVGLGLFKSIEVTLFLSTLGGILSLLALHKITTHYFKLSPNYSILIILLLVLTPAVSNHWIIEFKIDLALLFIQMAVLLLLFHWLFEVRSKFRKNIWKFQNLDFRYAITIGLLLGFSLSIKALSIYLVFAVILMIWWLSKDFWGVIGLSIGGFGGALFLGLDEISGLRSYHQGVVQITIVLLIVSALFLVFSFRENKDRFISMAKMVSIIVVMQIVAFSPWMAKNYSYSKSVSPKTLLIGQNPPPAVNMNDIIQTYENLKKEQ